MKKKLISEIFWSLSPMIVVLSLIIFLIGWKEPMASEPLITQISEYSR